MEARFDYRRYARPFRQPLRTATRVWKERQGILIRLEDGAGRVGFGEIAPLDNFGTETLAEAEAQLQSLGERIGPRAVESVSPVRYPCTRFALETSLDELNPPPDARPAERLTRTTALLASGDAALGELPELLDRGYEHFKLKIAVANLEDEQRRVAALLERLGERGWLRLDANGGLTVEDARRWIDFLAGQPRLEFIEEPLPAFDKATARSSFTPTDDFMEVQAKAVGHGVSLAFDESTTRLNDLQRLQVAAPDVVFAVKPLIAGSRAEFLHWRSSNRDARVYFSSALETVVGLRAALRLAATDPGKPRAAGLGTQHHFDPGPLTGTQIPPICPPDFLTAESAAEAWASLG